jgi:hypothetical protein
VENYKTAHEMLNNLVYDLKLNSTDRKCQPLRAKAVVIRNASSVQHNIFMPVKVVGKDCD